MLRDQKKSRAIAGGLAALFGVSSLGCSTFQREGEVESEPSVITESSPTPSGSVRGDLPVGAELEVRLDRPLSSEDNREGDPWRATLAHDVTDGSRVLLTRGAVVSGVVTRAGPVEIEGETRQIIALEPQTLHVSDGELPIQAEVVHAEVKRRKDTFSTKNIAIVGGSTVAGAILGEILFDEALLGAVLGGAGGTVVAIATADTEIELDEGSRLTLRLQEEVRIAQGGGSSR